MMAGMTMPVDELDDGAWVSDEELAALALGADPDAPLDDDAVPFGDVFGTDEAALLPSWYMPGGIPSARGRPRWLKVLIVVLIVAFLVVDAYGLCSTYGDITIA